MWPLLSNIFAFPLVFNISKLRLEKMNRNVFKVNGPIVFMLSSSTIRHLEKNQLNTMKLKNL